MFIGTSPEFELALYTVCFLAGQEDNVIQVGDYEVRVKAYRIKSKYGDKVGSCYPEVRPHCILLASLITLISVSGHLLGSQSQQASCSTSPKVTCLYVKMQYMHCRQCQNRV